MSADREAERRERARVRAARGMVMEPIGSLDAPSPPLHDDETPEERLAAMARLCRAAWLATGRPWPKSERASMPGEVFRIRHGEPRRAA